jgi:hypothetical protein
MESNQPHILYESNRHIVNFHTNVKFTPARYCDVWNLWDDSSAPRAKRWRPGMMAIQQIIRDAESRNMPVRALGACWSLSRAAVTEGCLLNTKPLNVIEVGMRPEHCEQAFLNDLRNSEGKSPADFLVFAQCGATIAELNQELEPRGLALITSGAANGQTICGAISTGTHGAHWKFGAIHDFILGIHLISHQGESHWIEPASRPVMAKSFCDILGATLVRDDQLFYAALVSFGSFGVIHAVVLRSEPLYLLEQHTVPRHFNSVMDALPDLHNIAHKLDLVDIFGKVSSAPVHHFEMVLNPFALHPTSGGPKEYRDGMGAYVRYMFKRSPPDLQKFSPSDSLIGLKSKTTSASNEAFSILQRLDMLTPFWSGSDLAAQISKLIIDGFLLPDDPDTHLGTILTPGGTFAASGLPGRGLSCELGIAGKDLFKAIDILIRELHAFPLACMPSLRFVGGSKALLAPTFFEPYTCMMEFPASLSDRTLTGYHRIWQALERNDIAFTFHWGQCQSWGPTPLLARQRLEHVFGQRVIDWLQARDKFLPPKARRTTFAGELLADAGLLE